MRSAIGRRLLRARGWLARCRGRQCRCKFGRGRGRVGLVGRRVGQVRQLTPDDVGQGGALFEFFVVGHGEWTALATPVEQRDNRKQTANGYRTRTKGLRRD